MSDLFDGRGATSTTESPRQPESSSTAPSPDTAATNRSLPPLEGVKGSASRGGGTAARLIRRLLVRMDRPAIRVALPDGQVISGNPSEASAGTVVFHDRRTMLAIAVDPMFQFGEAYSDGRIEVEGDLARFLEVVYRGMNRAGTQPLHQRFWQWLRRPRPTTIRRAQENIHHHYDIGNDFYRLWLDEQLLYTCAYFARAEMSLEEAQIAKMDHVCRKLRLQSGMEVIEAGCGWGSLAIHMARHYGVRVRAFNISKEQITWARQRASHEGLTGQVEFIQDDWRNIRGRCDAFASVGMLEHVGVGNYPRLGRMIRETLRPEGLGLIHSIGQNVAYPLNAWIERRIFPGACAPAPSQISRIFEPHGFSVLDVENLRLHYAETLRHWLARYERNEHVVREQFGEKFVRIWRFYLSGSMAAFESGSLQLFQIVFAHGASNNVPATRDHLS